MRYRGVDINVETNIKQNIYDIEEENNTGGGTPGDFIKPYFCRKIDGIKYYNNGAGENFSFLNNSFLAQKNGLDVVNNSNAVQYYKESYKLKEKIKDLGLLDLTVGNAIDSEGNQKKFENADMNMLIFDRLYATSGSGIEESDSNFNQHRQQVIRDVVEKNLGAAISNYAKTFTSVTSERYDFQMPKLKEEEWDKIQNNVTLISFLQGISIGGKIYNGYKLVPNNENEDFVADNAIYILKNDGYYHKINEKSLVDSNLPDFESWRGVFNADLEIHSIVSSIDKKNRFYIPKGTKNEGSVDIGSWEYGSYGGVVTSSDIEEEITDNDIYKYLESKGDSIKQLYYTALARERYGTYKGDRFVVKDLQNTNVSIVDGKIFAQHGNVDCGPTSIAMLLNAFGITNNTSPDEIWNLLSTNGYWSSASGTTFNAYNFIANQYNLKYEDIVVGETPGITTSDMAINKAIEILKNGGQVISCQQNGGIGSGGSPAGHIILLHKYDESTGKIEVYDPNGGKDNWYTPQQIIAKCRRFYGFSRK